MSKAIITKRNRSNAVSMSGELITWLTEILYILIIGIASNFIDSDVLNQVSPFVKDASFLVVPVVYIWTSGPLKEYYEKSK